MRWVLIVIGLLMLRGLIPSFGYEHTITDAVLIVLSVYVVTAVKRLQDSQRLLQEQFQDLNKQVLKQQNQQQDQQLSQVQAEPEPAPQNIASKPAKVSNFDVWTTEEPIWKDAPAQTAPLPLTEPEPIFQHINKPVADYAAEVRQTPTALETWLAGGNWIVRAGLGILFLGLVFLAKFAYDNVFIPLALRLAAIGVVGITLLSIGWRARLEKPSYGLSLQGGGVAILYLTIFATVKLTGQLPNSMALPLMLLVGVLAALLAIKQDAMILAVIGSIGGFMAPILLSDGHGNHIGLFSYYALLDVGVLTVALRKAWRPLNLLAFFFTFGIAGLWGLSRYQSAFMVSCLAFLLIFFAMFVALSVLFAQRQVAAGQSDTAIDAGLLFGVPATGFGYALYLLRPYEYGGAIAAVLLSTLYCALAVLVGKRDNFAALRSPWLAMALLFATLAVPLACDARLTSSVWALEGAAVIWYGWQQAGFNRRLFGYLLVSVGSFGFIAHWPSLNNSLPIFNASSVGLSILGLAYGVIGVACNRFADSRGNGSEAGFISRLAAVGLFVAGSCLIVTELHFRADWDHAAIAIPAVLWLWAWVLQYLAQRLQWPHLLAPTAMLPMVTLLLPMSTLSVDGYSSYSGIKLAALGLALIALLVWQALSLKKMLPDWLRHDSLAGLLSTILTLPGISVILFWWLIVVRCRYSFPVLFDPDHVLNMHGWFMPMVAALPALLLYWLAQKRYRQDDSSPLLWQALHGGMALPELSLTIQRRSLVLINVLYVLAVTLLYDGSSADASSYMPVFNAYELIAIGGLLALLNVCRYADFAAESRGRLLSFFFVNSILSRLLANYYQADFAMGFAWHSAVAATTYSIVWSLAALVAMWIASRTDRRGLWIVGAGLLGVVAVKLILIDQAQVGTLARIVSFLGVGALMLVIGYVAPIPANDAEDK
ncbi:MAG: DUF2339 domain-containing protein [Methylococcales bacterium]